MESGLKMARIAKTASTKKAVETAEAVAVAKAANRTTPPTHSRSHH